tara:strand:+ start:293 stop:1510 length:1218 start_codon:yes stop_codon:yes gene_type:complete
MKLLKTTLVLIGATALITTSCKKKGCMDPLAQNYSAEAEKEDKKDACTYEISTPATYTFTRNGNSTVSFGGQTTRMEMLSEMVTYMKTANTAGSSITETILKNMYANSGYTWADALGLGMTGSTKQLKNKTAYGSAGGSADVGVQNTFEGYMTSLANISATTTSGVEDGMSGTAGVWANDGVKGPYLMDAEGKEFTQLIEKGLMCSVLMSQITVNYLGGIASDDNTEIIEGKDYTEMEHHWDEAYGYFTDAIDFPTNGTDRFWGKYSDGRETILGSATTLSAAFRTGRAAIVSQDYTARDVQVTIIRNELEKVVAGSAIHYLNSAKSNIANNVARNHSLSEAYAFLEGLKYGYNSINSVGMTSAQIDSALSNFENDFNTVTLANINSAIDLIASNTGLESVKGSL